VVVCQSSAISLKDDSGHRKPAAGVKKGRDQAAIIAHIRRKTPKPYWHTTLTERKYKNTKAPIVNRAVSAVISNSFVIILQKEHKQQPNCDMPVTAKKP
jgi:hypothetical protein